MWTCYCTCIINSTFLLESNVIILVVRNRIVSFLLINKPRYDSNYITTLIALTTFVTLTKIQI
ncbi:LOW QUALITY PROTEIN: hypothetical protein V1477_011427 [Vespula maculifrons]|uniref:Uncharacterized protein n=1 Tax=Vespula maculifrons TaxID=7453 RepID=A0ABD2BZ58_VESMC